MRVMVALEDRFMRVPDGHIYSGTLFDYNFWKRYLQVFDEVVVLARVGDTAEEVKNKVPANGPGVSFFCLPYYVGPWQYIRQHCKLAALMEQAINCADAFILRIPGRIATLLWHRLMAEKIPYGVEVLGSSVDSNRTSGANFLVRCINGLLRGQKEECEHASVALYITQSYLQRLYPSYCWSISCSDVTLPEEAIISEAEQMKRIRLIKEAVNGHKSFRICHAGTMAALYKAQDVLIEAVSICLGRGLNMELTLLGDGKYRKYFENKARELRIADNVIFLGQLPPGQAVRNQLDRADIFVLPSLTEGQGMVLIEAMARGLPCVASDVGGIPELLDAEDLVPPGDAQSLAKKIEEVVGDFERLKRMSLRNLKKAREYSETELSSRRVEFYKRVAEISKGFHFC